MNSSVRFCSCQGKVLFHSCQIMSLLSAEDLKTIVARAFGSNIKILSHSLEPYTNLKNGILGTHQTLTIEIQRETSGDSESHTFFFKTQPDSELIRDFMNDGCNMFYEEVHFFNKICPLLTENSKAEKWLPTCFLAKSDVLVFEDLRSQGYMIRSEMQMDEKSLRSALSSLAQFHASSILAESRLGKTLREAYPNAFGEKLYTNLTKFSQSTIIGFETMASMADRFDLDSSLVPKIFDRVYKKVRAQEGGCNVLCHSDLWKNNLMFDNSVPPKCVIVDYQLLRYASPTIDFGMFFYINSTPESRKKMELSMFQHYYSAFRDALLQSCTGVKIPLYEDMLRDYLDRRMVGMMYGILYLPGLYLNTEDLDVILNNPVECDKWLFGNRFNFIKPSLDTDPVYEKKMKDILIEIFDEAKRVIKR